MTAPDVLALPIARAAGWRTAELRLDPGLEDAVPALLLGGADLGDVLPKVEAPGAVELRLAAMANEVAGCVWMADGGPLVLATTRDLVADMREHGWDAAKPHTRPRKVSVGGCSFYAEAFALMERTWAQRAVEEVVRRLQYWVNTMHEAAITLSEGHAVVVWRQAVHRIEEHLLRRADYGNVGVARWRDAPEAVGLRCADKALATLERALGEKTARAADGTAARAGPAGGS